MEKKKQKFKQVKVNFLPEQHEFLQQIAKEKGMTMAQLLRESVGTVFENPRKRNDPQPEKVEVILDKKWMKQIVGIARNINQMTKEMHEKKSLISLRAIKEAEDAFNEMNETVSDFMKSQK